MKQRIYLAGDPKNHNWRFQVKSQVTSPDGIDWLDITTESLKGDDEFLWRKKAIRSADIVFGYAEEGDNITILAYEEGFALASDALVIHAVDVSIPNTAFLHTNAHVVKGSLKSAIESLQEWVK